MRGIIIHIIIISLILLLSAVMNSYTITILSKKMAVKRDELRKTSWVEDSIRFLRFSKPYE
ncbi:MAG: hypothetical protein ABIL16_01440 [candidate division WOR-3 bacterium]